jgi:hypothetical protein
MNKRTVRVRDSQDGEWQILWPSNDGWFPTGPIEFLAAAIKDVYFDWEVICDGQVEMTKASYEIDLRHPVDDIQP